MNRVVIRAQSCGNVPILLANVRPDDDDFSQDVVHDGHKSRRADRERRREVEFLADVGAAGAPDFLEATRGRSAGSSIVATTTGTPRQMAPLQICGSGRTARSQKNDSDEDGGTTKHTQC